MKILLVMAEKNLRLIFKDKLSIIQLFIPILIIMFSIKLFSFSNGTVKIGIIDEDSSNSSKLLISSLSNNSSISTVPLESSTVESTMMETSIPVTIEIPKDFEESIINGTPKKINVLSEKDSSMGDAITSIVNLQVEDLYNLGINSNKSNDEYEKLRETATEINFYGIKIENEENIINVIEEIGKNLNLETTQGFYGQYELKTIEWVKFVYAIGRYIYRSELYSSVSSIIRNSPSYRGLWYFFHSFIF